MTRHICIHGHFYQPDRSNPWTGQIEREPTAAPFHDWTERITDECYRPNAAARRLSADGEVVDIVATYERISWNAGATLLGWLEQHDPWTYRAVLAADTASAKHFSGHGSAFGQPWVHAILPLANDRDRRTLIRWGRLDFEHRFGRATEGMWLPETAVDTATLETLAAEGIRFTVLAPWQAASVRASGGEWEPVTAVDTTRPYRCGLPSGREIALFFYDGALSSAIAFEGLLNSGDELASRLLGPVPAVDHALVHVATDGESYGHHHRWGEMALARALERIETEPDVSLTCYGEHLDRVPLDHEVRIAENTAWSCAHGIERWRSDCGCAGGREHGYRQSWRTPLREGLDWLRDELAGVFEEHGRRVLDDPWAARDDYVEVLHDPSLANQQRFLREHGGRPDDPSPALQLLEMQRHLLDAFESSAWFYDDAADLETVLSMRHAARAVQLARAATGIDLEAAFVDRLALMESNDPDIGDGRRIWREWVLAGERTPLDTARAWVARSIHDDDGEHDEVTAVAGSGLDIGVASGERLLASTIAVEPPTTRAAVDIEVAALRIEGHELLAAARVGAWSPPFPLGPIEAALAANDPTTATQLFVDAAGADRFVLNDLPADDRLDVLRSISSLERRSLDAQAIRLRTTRHALVATLHTEGLSIPPLLLDAFHAALVARVIDSLDQSVPDAATALVALAEADAERRTAGGPEGADARTDPPVTDPAVALALEAALARTALAGGNLEQVERLVEILTRLEQDHLGQVSDPAVARAGWWAQNLVLQHREADVGASRLSDLAAAVGVRL